MKKSSLTRLLASGIAALVLTCGCATTRDWKGLDKVILSNAEKNQTLQWGEQHGKYRLDTDLLIDILSDLKEKGFGYLALELQRNPEDKIEGVRQSKHIVKILADYASGKITKSDINLLSHYYIDKYARGWLDLIDAAKKTGLKIVCYDVDFRKFSLKDREILAFINLQELIFKEDHDAKVIVYCGFGHLNEEPAVRKRFHGDEKINHLGYYLEKYTGGKNFAIHLGKHFDPETVYYDLKIDLDNKEYRYTTIK